MNLEFTLPANFKDSLVRGNFDFDATNQAKAWLVRPDYVFNSSVVFHKDNFTADTGTHNFYIEASVNHNHATIHRKTGTSYITEGFVTGNHIKMDVTTTIGVPPDDVDYNDGIYKVVSVVDADTMKVAWVSGNKLASDGTDGAPLTNKTIWCIDSKDRYDDEALSAGVDIDFNIVVDGLTSTIVMSYISLDPVDGAFGAEISDVPGMLLVHDTNNKIIAYAAINPWALPY